VDVIRRKKIEERLTGTEIRLQPIHCCTCEALFVPQMVDQRSMMDAVESNKLVEGN